MKTRNKFQTALYALVMMLGVSTLTSCDDDNKLAMKLNGEWYGDFGMYYTAVDKKTGLEVTWDCIDTYMNFNSTIMYSADGYCRQVDYYPYRTRGYYVINGIEYTYDSPCPYEYIYHYVRWDITDRTILFTYKGERNWNTKIYDFNLSYHYFSGYFSETGAKFNMESISQGDDWWGCYCSTGNYYYYTRVADAEERTDGFTLCKTEQGNTLVDNIESPSIAVVLREGVDPSTIDLSTMKVGNKNSMSITE